MMKKIAFAALAASLLICSCSPDGQTVKYVDEFELGKAVCGKGYTIRPGKPVDGDTIKIAGTVYERGFGAHPESAVVFTANGKVSSFDAVVGVDDGCPDPAYKVNAAIFRVWADGQIVWDSKMIKGSDGAKDCHVELSGAKEIVLETASGAPWIDVNTSSGDWADARFTLDKGGKIRLFTSNAAFAQLGILTPAEKPEPQFNGADIWGVRPGHPVIFRVPISGQKPMTYTAEGLPEGVTFNAERGILGGVAPMRKGNYDIKVTAQNAVGKAEHVIRLAVGDTIALTPPMGWNSWNIWCYRLTAESAMASAKALDDSGLADYGWSYINLDDWWEMNNSGTARVAMREKDLGHEDVVGPARDAQGRINPNRSFPDMNALTDYIHSFGFKAGLYSGPGPLTCGKCEASYGHEMQDATSWAEWGFDYIKYDWCSYSQIFNEKMAQPGADEKQERIRPYALLNECLKKQDRDIFYSYCQYGEGDVHEWGRENGANSFRSWDDLKDGWTWMEMAIDSRIDGEFWKYTGPGFWADPDMMIVGGQYSYGVDHETLLTPNEQYAHVSLWAMVSSPLLIGCDVTKLSDFTYSLLSNREVIAISQDRLGLVARRVRHTDSESVWVRQLEGGDWAIALLNRYPKSKRISFDLSEAGIEGTYEVRDCWKQEDEGRVSGELSYEVLPHAVKLVRLHCADCPKCD